MPKPHSDPRIAELIADARAKFDAVKMAPEQKPGGFMKLIELRNVVPALLLELEAGDRGQLVDALQARATELAGCIEGSREELELKRIADLLELYEAAHD